jgi:hypothetical protein
MPDYTTPEFCEFLGIMMGDGCLSEYRTLGRKRSVIRIDGNRENDTEYYVHTIKPLIHKVFKKDVTVRFRNGYNVVFVYFSSREITDFMKSIGFPVGEKGEIQIPNKFLSLEWKCLRMIIRGFADTDGCVYFTKNNNQSHYYPAIDIRSMSNPLLKQFGSILGIHGFKPYWRDRHLILYGNFNIGMWEKEIGFSNFYHKSKVDFWRRFGYCPPEKVLKFQKRVKLLGY